MGVIDICLKIFRILSDSPLTILLATAVHEYNIMSQPHYCAMRLRAVCIQFRLARPPRALH